MTASDTTGTDLGLVDVGFGILTIGSVASTIVGQLLWLIAFDETGLDRLLPDALFLYLLPAVTVALVPAVIASTLYSRGTAVAIAVGTFAAGLGIAVLTVPLFAL